MTSSLLSSERTRYELLTLIAISVGSTLVLYVPFALSMHSVLGVPLAETGFSVLQRYYDGPLFAIVSQTFYAPQSPIFDAYPWVSPAYYAAHLPGYPLCILVVSTA